MIEPPRATVLELLFFAGCPGYDELLPTVRRLAAETGAELRLREIDTPESAEAERFLGSPTVRVDGVDIDPDAAGRDDFGLKCRLFRCGGGQSRVPPESWMRAALQDAARRDEGTRAPRRLP